MQHSQSDIRPSHSDGSLVLDIHEAQPQNHGVELGGLFQQVVEVVRGPFNEPRQLFFFLFLDSLWVEGDVVLSECGNSTLVEQEFNAEGPEIEAHKRTKKRFVGEKSGHDG